ncbi:DUF6292 family protein [Amycolatopsis sp. MEPSY49]|uniref:DUF6292 family protein n=1 Tax=Amycolatopsis sp. MEPSY49 TaxID=3151600 RepID=UPI003EF64346
MPGYPDRDVALLWGEVHGWAAAIETTPAKTSSSFVVSAAPRSPRRPRTPPGS